MSVVNVEVMAMKNVGMEAVYVISLIAPIRAVLHTVFIVMANCWSADWKKLGI